MGEKEIYQWLHQAREAGLSDMNIVEKLINQGWSNTDIDKILVGAYSENIPLPQPPKRDKIFSPAEKFQKERKSKDKDPFKNLTNYKYSGKIGEGSFKKLFILLKNNWKTILTLYILIAACLSAMVITSQSMPFLGLIFILLLFIIFFLALIIITKDIWSISQAFQDIFPLIFKYLYTMLLASLVLIGGFVLFIIPGVLISMSFTILPYIIVKENKYGFAALIRAQELAKGHRGKLFLYSLLFQFFIGIICGLIIIGIILLFNKLGLSDNNLLLSASNYSLIILVSLIYSLSAIASIAFYKSFYDELSLFKPSDDPLNYEPTKKNTKLYLFILFYLGLIIGSFYIYFFFSGANKLTINHLNIGSQALLEDNIDLKKLPFTYDAPKQFSNDYNNQYKNGYSSTYTYQIPNTTDNININIYLESNSNKITAEEYQKLNENLFGTIYDNITVLSEGEFQIDTTTGNYIEKTYEFFNSKKYSNKIIYIKQDYIIEISLECESRYYLDYKNIFTDSLTTFRMR